MSGDGDARGLEAAAAAAAAEAARELREAAAALVATRAAEEDALRRRAVALDADVRRLQGELHALDPSTLDKVLLASPSLSPPLLLPGSASSTSPPALCLLQDKVPSNSGSLSSVCVSQAMRKSVNNTTCIDASLKSEFNLMNQMVVRMLALVLRSFWFGSLHGFGSCKLLHVVQRGSLVEEELERARVAITDSDVASFLPSKRNGKFLKTFLGPVNVRVARKEDKLKIKDEYNNYRDRTAYKFLLFPSILLLLRWWIWDGCLPALAVQIYQAWLLYLYTSFALRENVLIANGSDIRPCLTWEIKGQPDCSSKQGVQLFLRWAIMQGIAMHLQNRYQRQRLRTRIALGKVNLTSLPINSLQAKKNGCRRWRNSWRGGAAVAAISCAFHIT
ncbi:unnamed protein product, partial [Miscanthus lutarioriparius]